MVQATGPAIRGACDCGACNFELQHVPKVRLVCHCKLCQAFTGKDYSDVALIPACRAKLIGLDGATFRRYRKYRLPPPNLNRGRCNICLGPVVEIAGVWPMKILFLPVANFAMKELLPRPEAQLFCEHRESDVDDTIPKHFGYFDSQGAIVKLIAHAL